MKGYFKVLVVSLALIFGAIGVVAADELPAGEVVLIDNFEDGNYWQAVGTSWDQWGAHNLSLEANLYEEWGTDGPTSAEWVYDKIPLKGSDWWKACKLADNGWAQAIFFCDQLALTDWSGANYVAIDVNNPNDYPLHLEFCAQVTDGWKWFQTALVDAQPGVSTIVFELKGFTDLNAMKRAMFAVIGTGDTAYDEGEIYADNIRIIK